MLSPILLTVVADKFSLELLLKPLHKRFRLQRDPFLDGEISYQTRNIGLWRFPFWISRVILLTPKIYWFFFSFETGTGSITLNVMYDCMLHFTLNLKRLPFPPPPPQKKSVATEWCCYQWTNFKSSVQDEVYFMGGGAAGGLWRHQT